MILAAVYQHYKCSWPLKGDNWYDCIIGSRAGKNWAMHAVALPFPLFSDAVYNSKEIGASYVTGAWS